MTNIKTNNSNFIKIIKKKLEKSNIQYEFIPFPKDLPLDTASLIKFHQLKLHESVPTLVYKTEKGFIAVQKRSDTRLNLKKLKALIGIKRLTFANPEELKQMGVEPGIVPLVGLDLPYHLDQKVLDINAAYGGSGLKNFTLKINPADLLAVNHTIIGDFTEFINTAGALL